MDDDKIVKIFNMLTNQLSNIEYSVDSINKKVTSKKIYLERRKSIIDKFNILKNMEDDKIVKIFDMLTNQLSNIKFSVDSIDKKVTSINNHNIYLERRKSTIDGSIFGWDFNVYFYNNNKEYSKAEAILFSMDNFYPSNFAEKFVSRQYDSVLNHNSINVNMIHSLNLNDYDICNYKYKNIPIVDIVFLHLFNENLEKYGLYIEYITSYNQIVLQTNSKKNLYVDNQTVSQIKDDLYIYEFISPFLQVCKDLDFKPFDNDLEVQKICKIDIVALYMIDNAKDKAKNLWNEYSNYDKNIIYKNLKINKYFQNYRFNFNDFTAKNMTLNKHKFNYS